MTRCYSARRRSPEQPRAGAVVRTKPRIGPANDPLEREADRAADAALAGRPVQISASASSAARRECDECQAEDEKALRRMAAEENEKEEQKEHVRRKEAGSGAGPASAERAASAVATGGSPLPPALRNYFEPRFGADLSDVRLHLDAGAAAASVAIDARAYTLGNRIAFAHGEFAPHTDAGRRLVAHELAHVLQDDAGAHRAIRRGDSGLFGGGCCNHSQGTEWALTGEPGAWQSLGPGECTGSLEDCDGMTCGGGFYAVRDFMSGSCRRPRQDDWYYRSRRWTPTQAGPNAYSPTYRGSGAGDVPPGYAYD